MKFILICILVILAGCSASDEPIPKGRRRDILKNEFSRKFEVKKKEVTLGEATTPILDKGENRVSNIVTACEKINGTEVGAGGIFSFNSTTGERSRENGYKDAPVLIAGEKSVGIGGGVCQVSSTIYMAALNAGLDIAEHHNHSEDVPYTSSGKDATVVYGVKDLKIKNNTDTSVYIYSWVENGKVFSKIIKKGIDIQEK